MSLSDELYSLYYMLLYIVVSLQIAECFVHECFFWQVVVVVGGGGGERKCGSQHFSRDRQIEKLMDRKMKEIMGYKQGKRKREMGERES